MLVSRALNQLIALGLMGAVVAVCAGCLRTNRTNLAASVETPTGQATRTDAFLHPTSSLRSTPTAGSAPVLGGFTYFAGGDPTTGVELWRTDGTAAGTTLVKDLSPGPESSSPTGLITVGSLVFFSASYPDVRGRGLWRSDGTTTGTFPVMFTGGNVVVTAAGTRAIFTDAAGALYSSDGTVAGTIPLGFTPLLARSFASGGAAYFAAIVGGTEFLYSTDGTVANTTQIGPVTGVPLAIIGGGVLLETVANGDLLRADLTTGASITLSAALSPGRLLAAFTGTNHVYLRRGTELFATDGTAANTVEVASFSQASNVSFADLNGTVLFAAYEDTQGFGLWRSDGTAAGTTFVRPFPLGVSGLVSVGTTAYFQADDATSGRELWKSDGTLAGTSIVADVVPGNGSSDPGLIFGIGAQRYFFAKGANQAQGLWRTDDTAAGTAKVRDVRVPSGPEESSQIETVQLGANRLLVTTEHEIELVAPEGAPVRLATFANAIASPPYALGTGALFSVSSVLAPTADLWITDGTVGGTKLLAPLGAFPNTSLSDPARVSQTASIGNVGIVFVSTVIPPSLQVWRTNGTAAGTVLLRDFGTTVTRPSVSGISFGGKYYFVVSTAGGGNLWVTDGTPAGTVQALPTFQVEEPLLSFQNKMIFLASNPSTDPAQLYSSDGTVAGTSPLLTGALSTQVAGLGAAGKDLFYFQSSLDGFLWSSNGTNAGTVDLGIAPADQPLITDEGALLQGTLAGAAALFFSNGTSPGTRVVPSVAIPGLRSQPSLSEVASMQRFNTYFISARTNYTEPNPTTLATSVVPGPNYALWRAPPTLSATSLVRTPAGTGGFLRTPLVQLGSLLVGIGGDDFNPYGQVVYLNSW